MRYCGRHVVFVGLQSEKHFRTINVQWIGQWSLLAVVAFHRINNLRVINIVISSTPAAFTKYSRVQSLTRFSRQNRGTSLPALDDEYRLVVNDISFTDLL